MTTMDQVRTHSGRDQAESMIRGMDEGVTSQTGISPFHILTILSILGSIALFLSGKKEEAIFVGLWPPTFQALKSAAENS